MSVIKKLFLWLFCTTILVGCSNRTSSDSIIDADTFVDVLVDIHLTDAILTVKGYRILSDSVNIRMFYNDVLVKHKVTQKQIQNSLAYYSKKPKKFEEIYNKVSEKIVKREEEFEKNIKNRSVSGNPTEKENRIEDEYE